MGSDRTLALLAAGGGPLGLLHAPWVRGDNHLLTDVREADVRALMSRSVDKMAASVCSNMDGTGSSIAKTDCLKGTLQTVPITPTLEGILELTVVALLKAQVANLPATVPMHVTFRLDHTELRRGESINRKIAAQELDMDCVHCSLTE